MTMKRATHVYTRFNWECYSCEARGMILRHRDDSDAKAEWRRDQSHRAQQRRDRCPHPALHWRVPLQGKPMRKTIMINLAGV